MTPLRLSYIWYRRLYMALFLASLGYITLYILPTINLQYIPTTVKVDLFAAIGSAVVAVASIVLFVLAKKTPSWLPAFITYAVFTLTTAYLVQSTEGVHSS